MDFSDYKQFLDEFFDEFTKTGIDLNLLRLDHLAYRSSSFEDFDDIKKEFLTIADLFRESLVRGQKVAMFKLKETWKYQNYTIEAIELVSPKEGEIVKPWWEHVEFLLKEDFETFMKKYPKLDWETKDMNEPDFPMIKLKLTDNMRVKFPKYSILENK